MWYNHYNFKPFQYHDWTGSVLFLSRVRMNVGAYEAFFQQTRKGQHPALPRNGFYAAILRFCYKLLKSCHSHKLKYVQYLYHTN